MRAGPQSTLGSTGEAQASLAIAGSDNPDGLLTDDETGKLINISLWETREEMEAVARGTAAGIHDQAVPETGVTSLHLETYEVAMQV